MPNTIHVMCSIPNDGLHPLAQSALESWLAGTGATLLEVVRYATLTNSANIDWATCLLRIAS